MTISFQDHLRALRRPAAPTLATRRLHKSTLVFSEIAGSAGHGLTEPFPYDDAYLVAVRLVEGKQARMFYEGREAKRYDLRRGAMHIHDLRRRPQVEVHDSFHTLNAYLPRAFLVAFCEQHGMTFQDFPTDARAGAIDPTVEGLLRALQPALARPTEASSLFLDHIAMALCAHLCMTYGGQVHISTPARAGGLSATHLQTCLEMIEDHLDTDMSLAWMAKAFDMSVRHFTRLFVRSTGEPPYRYVLRRRIERAKILLREPSLSLADIANACGFSDQSHFTRAFTNATGVSPGAFRRELG